MHPEQTSSSVSLLAAAGWSVASYRGVQVHELWEPKVQEEETGVSYKGVYHGRNIQTAQKSWGV